MVTLTLWALWVLFFGTAAFWLLVGSVAYWVKHGWLPPDTSGWVQGLSAIVAIAIAIAVPWYQKRHDLTLKEREKRLLEVARSEQLLCLCQEVQIFVDSQPYDDAHADYKPSNEMRRTILTDQLARLTETQKGELNAERMRIGLKLRFEIHDWLKYFAGDVPPALGDFFDRTWKRQPRLERIRDEAENEVRKLDGRPLIEPPQPAVKEEEDLPW
ncbi:hypothetical protein [Pseudomonas sp. 2725]|uniref:hypothetical protein n=1 Tax=Pseudomonas sp. 2725 TaxID=3156449 RepID=UPI003D249426